MKLTEREGVNAVSQIFTKELGWIFREQTIVDWGIDAQVETATEDKPTGRLLALQIKSGKSFFRKRSENYVYYGEERHLRYWRGHSLPVVIILHHPETGLTLWQRVDEGHIRFHRAGRWSIEIPPDHVLNAAAAERLEKGVSDASAFRKLRLTLDLPMIGEFAGRPEIYFVVEEWVNKSLGFRDCKIYFDSEKIYGGEPDYIVSQWVPTHSMAEYMAEVWPWLCYDYVDDEPERSGAEEVEEHKVNVVLSDIGKAILTLEDYYERGVEVIEPEVDVDADFLDEETEEYYRSLVEDSAELDDEK
ncbi:conserved hypothetical protein [Bradyrhizobium sp. ORS 278]|uniref:DUF4365 domain-containing protein n=1 Tax=Bradyrhizobium sp. (strain ORS 278) TaxID=114615 RepID=UPI0001507863|nr:DUF4365 domain-containing protein [Bradyrhizobium sp. ORS 278]CAL74728.1 conserved hypothetical protein [Bradyrhizobium sp. ORS 278]